MDVVELNDAGCFLGKYMVHAQLGGIYGIVYKKLFYMPGWSSNKSKKVSYSVSHAEGQAMEAGVINVVWISKFIEEVLTVSLGKYLYTDSEILAQLLAKYDHDKKNYMVEAINGASSGIDAYNIVAQKMQERGHKANTLPKRVGPQELD